jgi:uncharacterized PurR-regulated membrane protein YhhQ (DUF165 family)
MKKFINDFRDLLRSVPPLIAAMFIISVVGMNLLANKSIDTGVEWLALDCGILLSWITFLSMDVMTHCYGPWAATGMSIAALLINLVMACIFFIAGSVPGVWGESFVEGSEAVINTALDNTFRGAWFILLGSSIAFIISALVNNFLNYGIGKRVQKDGFGTFALRSYVSTVIAQFTDNLVFALLVSKIFFGWTLTQCVTCALTGACLELLFEVFFSPLGYRIAKGIREDRIVGARLQKA